MRFYRNPFRDAHGLQAGRIDMGVDYSVSSDSFIHPVGTARIVRFDTNASWPGGQYLAYQLLHGAAKGKVIYIAEHLTLNPKYKVGDVVRWWNHVATQHPGFPNIETGWAKNEPGYPPLAYGCYNEGDLTHAGMNFSEFLHCLGAPRGLTQGRTPRCALPAGWPRTWC